MLWGFEDSGATERVTRCLRDVICPRRLVVVAVLGRQTACSDRHHRVVELVIDAGA
jgi:hypothetical protein